MATVERVEELKKYMGVNPRPKDFDAYWDNALEEMRNVDSACTLTPAKFQTSYAECYDMYFTGVGGARIYAKILKPKNVTGKIPALLMFHGFLANCGDWSDKLQYVAQGFLVAAMDCRGQGGLSRDVGCPNGTGVHGQFVRGLDGDKNDLLMRNVFLDTAQLAKLVMEMPEVDETRVCATGGSQGGALTLACAALEPRIRKIGVLYPFLSDYKWIWQVGHAYSAYEELAKYFRGCDPLHEREEEAFQKLGYIDVHNLASRIKAEVLMAISLLDDVCPPETQFAVYNHIQSKKESVLYHDYGHELILPGFADRLYQYFGEVME